VSHPDAEGRHARRHARRTASLGSKELQPAGWGAKHTRALRVYLAGRPTEVAAEAAVLSELIESAEESK